MEENEFVSLQDAIALSTDAFGVDSNVTEILQKIMDVMVSSQYTYNDSALSELEELCR